LVEAGHLGRVTTGRGKINVEIRAVFHHRKQQEVSPGEVKRERLPLTGKGEEEDEKSYIRGDASAPETTGSFSEMGGVSGVDPETENATKATNRKGREGSQKKGEATWGLRGEQ